MPLPVGIRQQQETLEPPLFLGGGRYGVPGNAERLLDLAGLDPGGRYPRVHSLASSLLAGTSLRPENYRRRKPGESVMLPSFERGLVYRQPFALPRHAEAGGVPDSLL